METETRARLAMLKDGQPGERGARGEKGDPGTGIVVGMGAPLGVAESGTLYFDAETGDLYVCRTADDYCQDPETGLLCGREPGGGGDSGPPTEGGGGHATVASDLYHANGGRGKVTAADIIGRQGAAEKIHDVEARLAASVPTNAPVSEGGHVRPDGTYTPERQAIQNQILNDIFTPEAIAAATPGAGEMSEKEGKDLAKQVWGSKGDIYRTGDYAKNPQTGEMELVKPTGYQVGYYRSGRHGPIWTPKGEGKTLRDAFENARQETEGTRAHTKLSEALEQMKKPRLDVLGGRGGSGKSFLTKPGGPVNSKNALLLDSDRVKGMLPEYQGWNAAMLHEEATHILNMADRRATALGINTIHDGTLKTEKNVAARIAQYKAKGYDVNGYFVHTTPETAADRALGRFMRGGETGRYVPPDVILNNTTNEKSFDNMKGGFAHWQLYDNNGSAPKLIAEGHNK